MRLVVIVFSGILLLLTAAQPELYSTGESGFHSRDVSYPYSDYAPAYIEFAAGAGLSSPFVMGLQKNHDLVTIGRGYDYSWMMGTGRFLRSWNAFGKYVPRAVINMNPESLPAISISSQALASEKFAQDNWRPNPVDYGTSSSREFMGDDWQPEDPSSVDHPGQTKFLKSDEKPKLPLVY